MLEALAGVDQAVFLFINKTIANPVTDWLMPIVTNDDYLRIAYGLAMVLLLIRGNARLRWLVLFSAIALLISDQISAGFLKPLIDRPRPCHVMENINLLVGCGGGRSMPSAHAANAFAQAALFSVLYRRAGYWLWPLASLIGISRVFVGVHYPGDVVVGAMIGAADGIAMAFLFDLFYQRVWLRRRHEYRGGGDSPSARKE
jgi:undecaprenyl-diphosphatase